MVVVRAILPILSGSFLLFLRPLINNLTEQKQLLLPGSFSMPLKSW